MEDPLGARPSGGSSRDHLGRATRGARRPRIGRQEARPEPRRLRRCLWRLHKSRTLAAAKRLAQCERLADKARLEAQSAAWDTLRVVQEKTPSVPAVEAYLAQRLMPLAQEDASHYNENRPLGEAIQEAVARAEIAAGWPGELRALAAMLAGGEIKGEGGKAMTDRLVRHSVESPLRPCNTWARVQEP